MSSLAIIYNGPGTNKFCVKQAIKSYKAHLNDKEVQVQTHDYYSLNYAVTQIGMKRKWIIFPGGHAGEMATSPPIANSLNTLWMTQEKVDFIGHCAGSIFLGYDAAHYSQNIKGIFKSTKIANTVGAYQGRIAAPCLPFTLPTSSPCNCKAVYVQHYLESSNKKVNFFSSICNGPAFPKPLNCKIVRTISDNVDICTNVEALHQGVDLPIAILDKNRLGNRVFLHGDHLEIDPLALDQDKFETMYSKSQLELQEATMPIYTSPKEIQAKNYKEMQQKLMVSNAARIEALRDGMTLLDMPLQPFSL